jgi:hypothetical protein
MAVTIKTPNHGLKNGNIAIDDKIVAIIKFIGVIPNIYNNITDNMKWYITINKMAWIKFVMDDNNYCLPKENNYFIVLFVDLPERIVNKNVVINVVMLKMEFESKDNTQVKLPKNSLNKFVPVEKTLCKSSVPPWSVKPLYAIAFCAKEYHVHII